ncbi:MAG TPA: hypothetical protein VGS06_13040 [Streptosporangiaceae bacterium]|nr:hypothetical protein [Streptosporangiaceae bacterium]
MSARTPASGARRASRVAAIALAALAVLILAASLLLYALTRQNLAENGGQDVVIFATFVTVGLVIAWHRPGNPIGWIILAAIDFQGLAVAGSVYLTLSRRPGYHLPVGPLLWLDSAWFVGIGVVPLVILLFPDGRPPSRRWRRAMWSYLALLGGYFVCTYAAVIIAVAGHRTRLAADGTPEFLEHPAGWYAAVTMVFNVLLPAFWLLFVVAQVMSWRRSSGERRQQLKWLLAGAAVLAVSQAVLQPVVALPNLSVTAQGILNTISAFTLAALPVGVAVAIMRYRLYDIDRIISRTLSYAIVTGLLVGVYAGLVLLATEVLSVTSPVAVAAATLAAAALFNPVRRRVQRAVDRRFNRARYDADRTIEAFAARLQDSVDLAAVQADLASVVHRALEPAHVTLWTNDRG